MQTATTARRSGLSAVVAIIAVAVSLPSGALGATPATPGPPSVTTRGVSHIRGASATLNGVVDPNGIATSYYFQYGPTIAYGSQTAPASLPAEFKSERVGQQVNKLVIGYHYRIVATSTNANGTINTAVGKDEAYVATSTKPKVELAEAEGTTVFGGTYAISGKLSGTGSAGRQVVLQASAFPFVEPFETIGSPVTTNSLGAFSLHASGLRLSTQFRVATLDPRPIYSQIRTRQVAVKVSIKVTRLHGGKYKLSGTIMPAESGARVSVQLRKAIRPNRKEEEFKFASQFKTKSTRGGKTYSRYSIVVAPATTGRYRVEVKLRSGAVVTGDSSGVQLRKAPASAKPEHHKHKH
jgi:hypothetical protein